MVGKDNSSYDQHVWPVVSDISYYNARFLRGDEPTDREDTFLPLCEGEANLLG